MKNFRLNQMSIVALFFLFTFLGCEEGGDGCIAEGTFVATPTGEKLIENLQVGDVVYSYDVTTCKLEPSKVLFIKKFYHPCYQFSVSDNNKLVTTKTHPIYSPQTGKYELAEKWIDKELTDLAFVKQNQNFISLSSNTVLPVGKKVVYDITVASPHANFIANGFLVHNKSLPPQMTDPVDDLGLISKSDSSLTFSWTVPGNINVYTKEYEMKISDSGFIDYTSNHDLWQYDNVDSLPLASVFGTKDTFEVKGLTTQKKYWFVIQTISNSGDYSGYSNEVVDSTS